MKSSAHTLPPTLGWWMGTEKVSSSLSRTAFKITGISSQPDPEDTWTEAVAHLKDPEVSSQL